MPREPCQCFWQYALLCNGHQNCKWNMCNSVFTCKTDYSQLSQYSEAERWQWLWLIFDCLCNYFVHHQKWTMTSQSYASTFTTASRTITYHFFPALVHNEKQSRLHQKLFLYNMYVQKTRKWEDGSVRQFPGMVSRQLY